MAVPGRWNERTDRFVQSTEIKQPLRVVSADLDPIRLGDLGGIEPAAALHVILERIVDREQYAVGADGQHRRNERRRAEGAPGRNGEIIAEIFAHGALG